MSPQTNNWTPIIGDETKQLLDNLGIDQESKQVILSEAIELLSLCGSPQNNSSREVGLAFGYVQSGKTMSFTTLAALARDNHYRMIIIIAGVSTSLLNQSTKRLMKDLRLGDRYDRQWLGVLQTSLSQTDQNLIEEAIRNWNDDTYWEDDRKTILVTVMKNTDHLNNLIQTLSRLDLNGSPVLIIDDEGDQASLNTLERRNALNEIDREDYEPMLHLSTIHRQIDHIRDLCPHHSLVQYTATPQANLFVNILNRLSPNFLRLLTPGNSYTGGRTYFINEPRLVREIPRTDIPSDNNILSEAPPSLIYALQLFFLGVAYGKVTKKMERNRSMMVHPSRLRDDHRTYLNWVQAVKDRFSMVLEFEDDVEDKIELLEEFKRAYNDLATTVNDLPPFMNLIGRRTSTDVLYHSINNTQIELINAAENGRTPEVDWRNNYSYILVGGQTMARGFTVEGLTVTYMPRNVGVGNIDTIQQRARFFGYKSSYIGLCRVYLDRQTINAYTHYVEHEENLRKSLQETIDKDVSLDNWSRSVILDRAYRVARNNIFSNVINRRSFQNQWREINFPHYNNTSIEENRRVIEEFLSQHTEAFQEDSGDENRTDNQRHLVAEIPLIEIYNEILLRYRVAQPDDSDVSTTIISLVQNYLELEPHSTGLVYQMSKGSTRIRAQDAGGAISNYFQGANRPTGYFGDKTVKDESKLSIQIHRLDIKRDAESRSPIIYYGVYGLTIWVPGAIGRQITYQGEEL